MALYGAENSVGFPDKDARIPQKFATAQKCLCNLKVRLLGKALDGRDCITIATLDISIASAENNVTMSTLGNDIYMYTAGDKPERITLSGVTCYDACSESDGTSDPLMELYSQSKSGTLKSWFKMLLNGITYRVYLIKCTRNVSSVQEDLDTFRLELVGVRA